MELEEAAVFSGGHWVASQLQRTEVMWKYMNYLHQVSEGVALLDQIDLILMDIIDMNVFYQVKSVASGFMCENK